MITSSSFLSVLWFHFCLVFKAVAMFLMPCVVGMLGVRGAMTEVNARYEVSLLVRRRLNPLSPNFKKMNVLDCLSFVTLAGIHKRLS